MTSTVYPLPDNIEVHDLGVPTSVIERQTSEVQNKNETGRVPKRILHFSDGTIEEYSSDDETDDIEPKFQKTYCQDVNAINPTTLAWIPWMWYQTSFVGGKALAVCDFFGEYLASFFGIITPKYEYEIEHFKRMVEEEKEKKKNDLELGSWAQQTKTGVISEQLKNIERCSAQWTHDIEKSCQV